MVWRDFFFFSLFKKVGSPSEATDCLICKQLDFFFFFLKWRFVDFGNLRFSLFNQKTHSLDLQFTTHFQSKWESVTWTHSLKYMNVRAFGQSYLSNGLFASISELSLTKKKKKSVKFNFSSCVSIKLSYTFIKITYRFSNLALIYTLQWKCHSWTSTVYILTLIMICVW